MIGERSTPSGIAGLGKKTPLRTVSVANKYKLVVVWFVVPKKCRVKTSPRHLDVAWTTKRNSSEIPFEREDNDATSVAVECSRKRCHISNGTPFPSEMHSSNPHLSQSFGVAQMDRISNRK